MFAQIATFEESAEQLNEGLRHLREEVIPSVGAVDGLVAAYWLVNPTGGKRLSLMLWDSDEAQAAAMPGIMQGVGSRRSAAGKTTPANAPTSVERFDVVGQARGGRPAEPVPAIA